MTFTILVIITTYVVCLIYAWVCLFVVYRPTRKISTHMETPVGRP